MRKNIFLILVLFISLQAPAQVQKIKNIETTRPATNPVLVNNQQAVIKNTVLTDPAYDFSTVKICVDQPSSGNNLPPRNNTAGKPIPKINSDGSLLTTGVI